MTPERMAEMYAEAIYGPPNAWGMHCHPVSGEVSHSIMHRLYKLVGEERANELIVHAMKEYRESVA